MMFRVTNKSRYARIVYHGAASTGTKVPIGESRDIDMSFRDALNAETDGVTVEHLAEQPLPPVPLPPEPEPESEPEPEPDDLTAADLLAQVETLHFQTFRSAATKILGEDTPATKAEIIAALQAVL